MQSRAYVDLVTAAGGVPLAVPPLPEQPLRRLYELCDGLLLPGGRDLDPAGYDDPADDAWATWHDAAHEDVPLDEPHPELDGVELTLARWARKDRLPVLGICRGLQVLNVALGGTLWTDLGRQRDVAHVGPPDGPATTLVHDVDVVPGTRLAATLGPRRVTVNSRHHQAVRELGAGLAVAATAADGTVEAVESADPGWFALAVQWHPEELVEDGATNALGHGLVGAAADGATSRR
jgi:putative glutamine amidotransferase